MEKLNFGARGPEVSCLGFGAMSLGGTLGAIDEAQSFACLDAMWAAGINHIDTSNIYGMGVSESVIGKWLASRKPEGAVIATKAGIINEPVRRAENSPAYLRAELEASLRRLGRERVDLFYIHRREQNRPLEEVIGCLQELEAEGKIGGYGLSEIAPSTLRAAHALHPCRAVQNEFSLWTRQVELGMLQETARLGVTLVAFSPLARGMLGQEALRFEAVQDGFRRANPRFASANFALNAARIEGFRLWCAERGWSVPSVALAWLRAKGGHVLPIPGTRLAAHLGQWLPLPRLSAEDLADIEQLLPAGFAAGDRYADTQYIAVERYC